MSGAAEGDRGHRPDSARAAREALPGRGASRYAPLVVAALGIAVTAGLFWGGRAIALARLQRSIEQDTATRARLIARAAEEVVVTTRALGWYFAGSDWVERDEFAQFARAALEGQPQVRSLTWAPLVRRDQRRAFEEFAATAADEPFTLVERDSQGEFTPAGDRATFWPVVLAVGQSAEETPHLGLDLGADPDRGAAIARASTGGQAAATDVRGAAARRGRPYLVSIAVVTSETGLPPGGLPGDGPVESGVAVAEVDLARLLDDALGPTPPLGLPFDLLDLDAPPERQMLYHWSARLTGRGLRRSFLSPRPPASTQGFAVADRSWAIVVTPNEAYVRNHYGASYALVAPAGLALTLGLALFVSSVQATRRRMEEEVGLRAEALLASEQRFREIADFLPLALYECDAAGTITFANRRALEGFGYTPEELALGTSVASMVAPPDRDRARAAISQVLEGASTLGEPYTACRKDASTFPVLIYSAPIWRGERVTGARGAIVDISAHARAEEERQRLEGQLQRAQRLESLGVLAGGIAHDFNNVLAVILGHAELAGEGPTLGARERESLRCIRDAADRARSLVQQILTFSRRAGGDRGAVDVREVTAEAVRFLRASLPATVEIRPEIDPACGTVAGDATQIHQVLVNLCTNAEHAMRGGDGVLEIHLAPVELDGAAGAALEVPAGRYVCLTVRDTGCGMSREVRERIFEPFYTTKGPGEGSGLGLSTVYGIVASHHGAIGVDSSEGEGSTFRVYLPACDDTSRPRPGVEEIPRGAGERVLVVDDEEAVAATVSGQLTSLGYVPVGATDSRAALALFRADSDAFDLVLTDYTMPHLTGTELADRIHQDRPEIPIVLMTGLSHAVGTGHGVDRVLAKPFHGAELAAAIRSALTGPR